jgi:hypothetical protein
LGIVERRFACGAAFVVLAFIVAFELNHLLTVAPLPVRKGPIKDRIAVAPLIAPKLSNIRPLEPPPPGKRILKADVAVH